MNIRQMEIENTMISVHDITVKTLDCMCKTSLSTETCTTPSRHEPIVILFLLLDYQYLLRNIHYSH